MLTAKRHHRGWLGVLLTVGLLVGESTRLSADELRIAAAASLSHALKDIAGRFEQRTGHTVRLSFGSSGNLARQIMQGAPFEVFFSANADYVSMLVDQSLTQGRGVVYGAGRLVLYAPSGSMISPADGLKGLAAGARRGALRKLAIANPKHAPYGIAARAALVAEGVWPDLESRLVLGENVAQAAQFAVSGSVDGALIAYSIVRSPGFPVGQFALVSSHLHQPLTQTAVVLKGAGDAAPELIRFLHGPEAREVLIHYGFEMPQRVLH